MTYLDYLEQKVLLERLVIGLEEPVLIKGLGELSAKIDSGNGGYNVIHGTDFHQQGNELMFTTHDSFGHEKKIQATVIDTIEVNMGGGNIENRPVIELDIKFAGEDYKKIPFSVSDRSTNTNPILISKGFVENELEALIDVGAMNISHEGIDVVYGQGIGGFLKGAAKMAGKGLWNATKTVAKGVRNAGDYLKGGENANLFAPVTGGVEAGYNAVKGVAGLALTPILGAIWGFSKLVKGFPKLISHDTELIRKKLPNSIIPKNLIADDNASVKGTIWEEYNKVDFKKIDIIPVTSFKGRLGENGDIITGMEQRVKNWKDELKNAEKACKEAKNKNNTTSEEQNQQNQTTPPTTPTESQQEQQECIFDIFGEAAMLLEYNEVIQQQVNNTTPTQPAPQQQQQPDQPTVNVDENELKQVSTEFEQLNNFVLYFVPSSLDKKGKPTSASRQAINQLLNGKKFDSLLLKLFNVGDVTPDSLRKIIESLASNLRNFLKNSFGGHGMSLYQGSFALVTGQMNNRKVHLFENANEVVYSQDSQKLQSQEQKSNNLKYVKDSLKKEFPDLQEEVSDPDTYEIPRNQDIINYLSPQGKTIIKKYNRKYNQAQNSGATAIRFNDSELQAILEPLLQGQAQTAILKAALAKNTIGQQIFKILGDDFSITNWDDFVNLCSQNDDIVKLLQQQYPPQQQDEEPIEDPWVEDKLQYFRDKGII